MLTQGKNLVSSVVYHINKIGLHDSIAVSELVKDKRVLIFMGPAPFGRLDTDQAIDFESHSKELLDAGIDEILGIYVQDAFVMKQFQDKVQADAGSANVKFYGDGDAFFVKANDIMQDFTFQGLSVRVGRYAVIVKDGVIEYVATDDYSLINQTSADSILKYLKNET